MIMLGVTICGIGIGLIVFSGPAKHEHEESSAAGGHRYSNGLTSTSEDKKSSEIPRTLETIPYTVVSDEDVFASLFNDSATSLPTAIQMPAIIELRRQLRALLDAAQKDIVLNDGIIRLLASIAEEGANPVDVLLEEYSRSSGNTHRASVVIAALQEVNTPEAKKALAGIALTSDVNDYAIGRWSVKAYAALDATAEELTALLKSKNPVVREMTLQCMIKLPLNETAVNALSPLLESTSWDTRQGVASIFGLDPQNDTAEKKIRMLMVSSQSINGLIDAEKADPKFGFTGKEFVLLSYASAMVNMSGADDILKDYLSVSDDTQRSLAVIALAHRGDKTVHDFLIQIIRQGDSNILRMRAVVALEHIAMEQDIPLLENLTKVDPYTRPSLDDEEDGFYYPVRIAAQRILKKLAK